jgi:hypothetical protein
MDESAEIFSSVYSAYIRVNKPLLDTVSTNINKALKNASPNNFTQIQDRLNQIAEIQARQLTRQIPSQKLAKELEKGWKKQIEDFDKYNIPVPTTSFVHNINIWFTKAFSDFDTVKNMIRNLLKSFDTLQDEFFELDKLATAKIRAGRDATTEIKRMADIIISINNKKGMIAEEVWNNMTTQGKQGWKNSISPEVHRKLAYESKGKPWDGLLEAISETDDSLKTAWGAYIDMFRFRKNFKDSISRWVSYISWGDPRKPAELVKVLKKNGIPFYIISRAVAFWVVTPAILSMARNSIFGVLSAVENIGYLFPDDERFDIVDWGEGKENWATELIDSYFDYIPGDGVWDSVGRFITPWSWDQVTEPFKVFFGGTQTEDLEGLKDKVKSDYEDFKNNLSDEEREKLERAENEAGLSDESISTETQTTEEQPLTFDPVLKDIFARYPCMKANFKNGDMKKISDTEFTIMGNGSKWTINIINGNPFYTKQNGVSLKSAYGKDRIPVQCQE